MSSLVIVIGQVEQFVFVVHNTDALLSLENLVALAIQNKFNCCFLHVIQQILLFECCLLKPKCNSDNLAMVLKTVDPVDKNHDESGCGSV